MFCNVCYGTSISLTTRPVAWRLLGILVGPDPGDSWSAQEGKPVEVRNMSRKVKKIMAIENFQKVLQRDVPSLYSGELSGWRPLGISSTSPWGDHRSNVGTHCICFRGQIPGLDWFFQQQTSPLDIKFFSFIQQGLHRVFQSSCQRICESR